jgi:hypothetical protein
MGTENLRSAQDLTILPLKYRCKNLNSRQKWQLLSYVKMEKFALSKLLKFMGEKRYSLLSFLTSALDGGQ